MLNELKKEANRALTENGAATLRSTGSDCLDLFATIGALRNAEDQEIIVRFARAYAEARDLVDDLLEANPNLGNSAFDSLVKKTMKAKGWI